MESAKKVHYCFGCNLMFTCSTCNRKDLFYGHCRVHQMRSRTQRHTLRRDNIGETQEIIN